MPTEVKNFDTPDETRPFQGNGQAKAVELGGHTVLEDGSDAEVSAGDVFAIPPGHDAEVTGPEACVMIDFGEIGAYAKPH